MYSIKRLYDTLDKIAPFCLSEKAVERGDYDNSGIIIKTHEKISAVLFSLDLSEETVKKAKRLSCDTVITHHPAVYRPIRRLSEDDAATAAVLSAVKAGLNVISCHLNLDYSEEGTDYALAEGLGAKSYKIIDKLDEAHGYGREFTVDATLSLMKKRIKEIFGTSKIAVYGKNKNAKLKCASFCGGGAGHALDCVKNGLTDADLIITSDMPHHVLKELTEYGKSIIILPHYAAEEYGFKKFYENVSAQVAGEIKTYYFSDKRFF